MTVTKSKRKESNVQFLQTTLELVLFTIQTCRKFPKGLTFYVSQPTVQAAKQVYANLKRGNSIFPKTQAELDRRIAYMQRARLDLYVLATEIDIAYELQKENLKETAIVNWYKLLNESYKLITAQIKSDKGRFQNLP